MNNYRIMEVEMEHSIMPDWASELDKKIDTLLDLLQNKSPVVGTKEAGMILGKSQSTVQRMYQDGKMPKPVSKPKEKLKFLRKDVEAMIAKNPAGGRPRKTT